MGRRVGRVLFNRLLKKFDGFSQPGFSALVPENPALQVKLMRFRGHVRALHRRSALGLQALSDSLRDILLHPDDVLNRSGVGVGPELETIGRVYKLSCYSFPSSGFFPSGFEQ